MFYLHELVLCKAYHLVNEYHLVNVLGQSLVLVLQDLILCLTSNNKNFDPFCKAVAVQRAEKEIGQGTMDNTNNWPAGPRNGLIALTSFLTSTRQPKRSWHRPW